MNICLIGNNLTSLTLAKALANKKINVFLYCKKKKKYDSSTRTLGLSKENIKFQISPFRLGFG